MEKIKNFIKVVSLVLLVGGAVILFDPSLSNSAEQWRLKFTTHEAPHALLNVQYWFWWCDRVEQLSGGAVKFDRFPSEQLVKTADQYEAVRDNIAQAGPYIIPYESGNISLPTIKELPFSLVDYETHAKMWHKFMDIGLNDYLNTYGIHVVGDLTTSTYNFWTTKKWGPIKRLEDLKGCKVRSPGGYVSKFFEAMGAVPVAISSPDVYTAVQRGTLDCICMPDASQLSFRFHELIGYITRSNYAVIGAPTAVNLKTWKSLPKNIQDIMYQAGREAEVNIAREYRKYEKEVADPTVLKQGIQIFTLSKEEEQRWKKASAFIWDDWLAKNGPTYNGLGKKMFDIVVETVGRP